MRTNSSIVQPLILAFPCSLILAIKIASCVTYNSFYYYSNNFLFHDAFSSASPDEVERQYTLEVTVNGRKLSDVEGSTYCGSSSSICTITVRLFVLLKIIFNHDNNPPTVS